MTGDALFTPDRPVVCAYHGYPSLIHRLTYARTNQGEWDKLGEVTRPALVGRRYG